MKIHVWATCIADWKWTTVSQGIPTCLGACIQGVKGEGNFGVEGMNESLWMGIGLEGYHTRSATGRMRLGDWIWRTGGRSEAMQLAHVVPWLKWLSFCFLKCKCVLNWSRFIFRHCLKQKLALKLQQVNIQIYYLLT